MKKVLFLTNSISPYRHAFFQEMSKYVNMTVLSEVSQSREREWKVQEEQSQSLQEIILKSWKRSLNDAFCPEVAKYLKKDFDHIIVGGYSTPTGMLAILWLKFHNKKFLLNADGGQLKPESKWKAKFKKFFISKADAWLSTGQQTTEYLLHYGAREDRIIRYPFTSLMESDIMPEPASSEENQSLREKLGITEKHVVLSVGRFNYLNGYGKGYDALIRAAQQLPEDIGWYIVGGAPTEEFSKIVEDTGLKNIHFVEFMDKESLKEYYRAADIFALMTVGDVWGLVINEAMACGLPVITTDKCVAGVELIENGKNGDIVKVGDDKALADRVQKILHVPGTTEEMGCQSLKTIQNYTIENMAKVHMEAFKE